ncbi:putative phage tail protein [Caproicibacterium sp. XB1]|uniref:putative phage tail protein n=1 Tax=Caproicibacterium sp. XB1 TaxID=3396405 RepID=UPI0039B6F683
MRTAQLELYLPDVLRNVTELRKITAAESTELSTWWEKAGDALDDMYLNYMTLNGVKRWESMLHIAPAGTMDDRRKAVVIRLNEMLPYTIRRLRQMLTAICGEDGYSITVEGYYLTVRLPALSYRVAWAVYDTLARIVPANMQNTIRLLFESATPVGIAVISKLGVTVTLYPWQVHKYESISTVRTAAATKSCLTVTVLERS